MAHADAPPTAGPVNLLSGEGPGTIWRMASEELDATLQAWPAAHEVAEHVHDDVDVFVVVLDGGGTASIDGVRHELSRGSAILVPRGARRGMTAGADGLRYLRVLRHRP